MGNNVFSEPFDFGEQCYDIIWFGRLLLYMSDWNYLARKNPGSNTKPKGIRRKHEGNQVEHLGIEVKHLSTELKQQEIGVNQLLQPGK